MPIVDPFLARVVKRGSLTVTDHHGRRRSFGVEDVTLPRVAIRFTRPGVALRILRDPALGFAEAWMDGGMEIDEGDIMGLLTLGLANNPWEKSGAVLAPGPVDRAIVGVKRRIDRHNRARTAKRNIARHYDIGNALYELFLDRDLQYSCGYFLDEAVTLDQAQLDKKAHIAAKLALKPGMRVLDIGCGWGGMALYLNRTYGVEVLGITLAEEQIALARQRAEAAGVADRVRFELCDYRALTGQFDRIVSVGMFEHVGMPQYRTFFAKCRELLTHDGVMLIHTIGRVGGPGVTDEFTARYIFPGGHIPALSEIAHGYEPCRLLLTDLEVLRLHYALTLEHWYERTRANHDRIVALYDERFWRMWMFYLAGAAVSFRYGGLVNYQLQFTRSRLTLPLTRDYIHDEELRIAGTTD